MAEKAIDTKRFSAGAIAEFIQRALVAVEMPCADARIVAKLMAEADINGSDGHGVFRLPGYIRRINEGGLNLKIDLIPIYDPSFQLSTIPTFQLGRSP